MSLAVRLAVSLLALTPFAVQADSAADAAAGLQAGIRAWMERVAGTDPGPHTVQVAPAGDDFRFELPVAGPVGGTGWRLSGDPVSAWAKTAGRRALGDRIAAPADASACRAGSHAGRRAARLDADAGRADHQRPVRSQPRQRLQPRGHAARLCPGRSGGGRRPQTTSFDRYSWVGGWKPDGDGRVTVAGEGKGENLSVVTDVPGRPDRASVTAAAMRNSLRVDGLSFDRLGAAVRSIASLLPGAAQTPGPAAPKDRARLRDLVLALRDLLGGAQQETALEHVQFGMGGQGGTLASLRIGGRAAATDGIVDVSLRLSAEGVDLPQVQLGPLHDYLPRRITLAPHISGIPADALVSLLLRGLDGGDPEQLQAEALTLLATSSLKAGLDDVVLDLGAAVVKASGTIAVATPDDIAGTARIVATGLDGLIRRADSVPELSGVAPFLLLLKGIGEQQGDATVWNVVYADGQTAVNGTDLSALLLGPAPERRRGRKP